MNLIQKFYEGFRRYGGDIAFNYNGAGYDYNQFLDYINGSRILLEQCPDFTPRQPVGVLCGEQVYTYAAIFAVWFSGGTFVPINPSMPNAVNRELIKKLGIKIILSSGSHSDDPDLKGVTVLHNKEISCNKEYPVYEWKGNDRLYILTTSGSTGVPKTVPVNLKNVEAFVEGFLDVFPELNASDNFLQTYDLTADASFTGYLIPFLLGATVYSVPKGGFKPFEIAKVMAMQPITWVQVTPSLLACLRPFFHSLNLGHIKHFHFGGEALPADLAEEWRNHIPYAELSNVYGPTETTITATVYKCLPGEKIKSMNNVVSIGKGLKDVAVTLHKEPGQQFDELYIGGKQVMEGYLFAEDQPFKYMDKDLHRYYPTGDFAGVDEEGYLYYFGRKDEQVKVNGYRVDLIEVENSVRSVLPDKSRIAATVAEAASGMQQLVVFIENFEGRGEDILRKLYAEMPDYKVPGKIIGVDQFPMSTAGKTDKQALVKKYLGKKEKDEQQ